LSSLDPVRSWQDVEDVIGWQRAERLAVKKEHGTFGGVDVEVPRLGVGLRHAGPVSAEELRAHGGRRFRKLLAVVVERIHVVVGVHLGVGERTEAARRGRDRTGLRVQLAGLFEAPGKSRATSFRHEHVSRSNLGIFRLCSGR
jgi:hypothetical protein